MDHVLMNVHQQSISNRVTLARLTYSLDAVLGILAVGAACLFGAAYNRHADVWMIIWTIFVPLSAAWSLLCYCAYKGLTTSNAVLKIVFWFHVACNVFIFPVGTGIAGLSVWLWRDLRKQ